MIIERGKRMNNIKKFELVKFIDDELEMDISVSPDEETIWMSLDQIGLLFDRDKSVISRHIKKIFTDNELDAKEVVAFFATTTHDGKTYVVKYYNLDVIISVGYRVNSQKGTNFRRWSNHVLKEYLLKGYIINENRVIVSNDNYIELKNKVIDIDNRLLKVEDQVLSKEHLLNKILYNGEFYDAYSLIQNIIESADCQIIIIDNYIDRTVLDRLVVKKEKVKVNIYTTTNAKLLPNDIQTFNQQYGPINVKYTNLVHDRYIIIDNIRLYHLGHSIKDLGKKISSISELETNLIQSLLESIK